jgi:hypothetical protein
MIMIRPAVPIGSPHNTLIQRWAIQIRGTMPFGAAAGGS